MKRLGIAIFMAFVSGLGCVQRTLTVTSDPPGAIVTLNDIEVGRTPVERDFTYYGWYDVQVRKDGYKTVNTRGKVIAPWWQWVPFDLVAELMPWRPHDRKALSYVLSPIDTSDDEKESLLGRAEVMRGQLQSSRFTKTAATTRSTTRAATSRASKSGS